MRIKNNGLHDTFTINCSRAEFESLVTAINHCKNTYPYDTTIDACEAAGKPEAASSWRKSANCMIKLSYDFAEAMWKEHEKAFDDREG
jgi:hypothetical protein